MADESQLNQNTQGADDSGDGHSAPQTVDKAEYDKVAGKAAELEALQKTAEELGCDSPQELIDYLAEKVVGFEQGEEQTKPPDESVLQNNDTEPPQNDELATLRKDFEGQTRDMRRDVGRQVGAAIYQAQEATFNQLQGSLPDEEKSPFKMEELKAAMKGKDRALIQHLAQNNPEYGGNMFNAASMYLSIKGGGKALREAGAKSADALNKAKGTANLERGTTIPAGEKVDDEDAYSKMVAPPTPFEG